MKNLFTRLRSWHTANRKYDGFVMMELWTAMLIFTLVVNVCRLSHDLVDWFHSFLSLFMVSFNAVLWQHDKEKTKLHTFYELLLRHAHDSEYAAIENSEQYRRWLVSANRRRKRAERKLKQYRKTLRKESAERLGFKVKVYEYEEMLLTAYAATFDYSGQQLTDEDIVRIKEAGRAFNRYMQSHYPEIARRKFWRDYK